VIAWWRFGGLSLRFNLPKPMHGWRAFWGEVGIIVLGVLIALGAQKAVDDWQWRQDVASTRAALADEIRVNAGNIAERQMIDACLRNRLADLLQMLRASGSQWRGTQDRLNYRTYVEGFRDFPTVYRAPGVDWPSDVWEAAKGGDVINHMRRDEVIQLASLYSTFGRLRSIQDEEQTIFPEFLHLGFDEPLDVTARRQSIAQIGRLHWANQMLIEDGDRAYDKIRALRGTIGAIDMREELRTRLAKQSRFRGDCVKPVKVTL